MRTLIAYATREGQTRRIAEHVAAGLRARAIDVVLHDVKTPFFADAWPRFDWACVAARVSGKSPPKGVDCEVVMERHHALNWLIGYQGQEWDDVSTDT